MKNKKQSILIITGLGLIASIAVAVYSKNNTSIFNSLAGGLVHTSDKNRTLTLDSSTPLSIDGTVGTLTLGNIGVYAPNCSSLANGVATLNNSRLMLYCPNAEFYGNYYQGFSGSNISSISITFKDLGASCNVRMHWGRLNKDTFAMGFATGGSYYSSIVSDGSEIEQTFTIDSTQNSDLLNYKKNGYSCLYLDTEGDNPIELISLTVQYSCK